MFAVTLSDFLNPEELSVDTCLLALIAVLLVFLVGWCFFDVAWKVFLSKVKFFCLALVFCCILSADWGSSDSSNLNQVKENTSATASNTEAMMSYLGSIFGSIQNASPGSSGRTSFFGEMLYGTDMARSDPESNNLSPFYPSNYAPFFGLRSTYKDNTMNYLGIINQTMTNPGVTSNSFQMSSFLNDGLGSYQYTPDDFLAKPNNQDILRKTDQEWVGDDGYHYNSRDDYIKTKMDDTSFREKQSISRAQSYMKASINKLGIFSNLTGTVVSFNLDWLVDYAQAIYPRASVPDGQEAPAPTFMQSWRNRQFVFRLVPQNEQDILYPFFMKWREHDSIIHACFNILCYGTVLLFIGDRVRALVEGS